MLLRPLLFVAPHKTKQKCTELSVIILGDILVMQYDSGQTICEHLSRTLITCIFYFYFSSYNYIQGVAQQAS
jgi:hypothetical protein